MYIYAKLCLPHNPPRGQDPSSNKMPSAKTYIPSTTRIHTVSTRPRKLLAYIYSSPRIYSRSKVYLHNPFPCEDVRCEFLCVCVCTVRSSYLCIYACSLVCLFGKSTSFSSLTSIRKLRQTCAARHTTRGLISLRSPRRIQFG